MAIGVLLLITYVQSFFKTSCWKISNGSFQNIFGGIFFSQKYHLHSVSNKLDPDQAGHSVRPDQGTNCLQRSLADDTSR